jgi:hypothetical protein
VFSCSARLFTPEHPIHSISLWIKHLPFLARNSL